MKWTIWTPRNEVQNTVGISTLWVWKHQFLPCMTREIIHQSPVAKNKPWHHISAFKVYIGGSPAPPNAAASALRFASEKCNTVLLIKLEMFKEIPELWGSCSARGQMSSIASHATHQPPNSIQQWLPTKPRLPGNLWKVLTEEQNHPLCPTDVCSFKKNIRHLWTPKVSGATWNHRCYSKRLDFFF